VNDSSFYYFPNPDPNATQAASTTVVQPIDVGKSAMLWIIIVITLVWGIFMYNGHQRDVRALKKKQAIRP
jgi:hypothetical protein